MTNFTQTKEWINSSYIRYNYKNIIKIGEKTIFIKDKKELTSIHSFDFKIKPNEIIKLKKYLKNNYSIKFKYINEKTYKKIKLYFKDYNIIKEDCWQAPILETKNIKKYLSENKKKQVKRNYKKTNEISKKIFFKYSNNKNKLDLWVDILKIDINSWKYKEKSDMKSLDREDLQYIFSILTQNNTSIIVSYLNNEPVAYSFMLLNKNKWYAVKWGATDKGREEYIGIITLYKHLIYLNQQNSKIIIDFWGRKSRAYDNLKNKSVTRYHLRIKEKKNEFKV